MHNEAQRKRAIEIVRRVMMMDSISQAEVTLEMSGYDKGSDPVAAAAIHAVSHFLTDVDIRQKDKQYNELLLGQLSEMLLELENVGSHRSAQTS